MWIARTDDGHVRQCSHHGDIFARVMRHAVRGKDREQGYKTFQEYSTLIDQQSKDLCTLRGLMNFREAAQPLKIEKR